MVTPARRGRPRKSTSPSGDAPKSDQVENIAVEVEEEPEEVAAEEEEEAKEEPKADLNPKNLPIDKEFRAQQWEMLTKRDQARLNMTREEFLEREDVTGFGYNSFFTPLEDR